MSEINQLSDREIEVLKLTATGLTNREIAQSLDISPNTVKVHLRNIFEKINVSSRTEASLYGVEHGIVDIPNVDNENTNNIPVKVFENVNWTFFSIILLFILVVLIFGIRFIVPQSVLNPATIAEFPERWQELAPFPEPISGMAVIGYDGNIYSVGGEGKDGISSYVFRYVTADDRWEQLSNKPLPVADVEGVVIGERIYIPGGRTEGGEPTDVLDVYDLRNDTWQQKASLPVKVSNYALAAFEGNMYLFGGWNGENLTDIVLQYDPIDDKWEFFGQMNSPRANAGAAMAGGKIFVIGGWDGEKAVDLNESYTPSRDIQDGEPWEVLTKLPSAEDKVGVASIADMIFVISENGIWQYTPRSDTWNFDGSKPPMPLNSEVSTSTLDSNIYLIDGSNIQEQQTSRFMRYQAVYSLVIPIIQNP